MLKINVSKHAAKFLKRIHQKHGRQVAKKLIALQGNPVPNDSVQLKGKYNKYRRSDIGEYRVIYYVQAAFLYIALIGKRNDDKIYKILERQ